MKFCCESFESSYSVINTLAPNIRIAKFKDRMNKKMIVGNFFGGLHFSEEAAKDLAKRLLSFR